MTFAEAIDRTPSADRPTGSELEPVELTDRELLESIAADLATIKALMGTAVESLGPLLGDAKVKLIMGALKGMFR